LGTTPAYTDTVQSIVEGHQYWDGNNSGITAVVNAYDYPISMALAIGQMRASGSSLKLFLGEVGFDNGSAAQAALGACLSVWQRNADIVQYVGLWGGGAFSNNYIYGNNNGNAPGTMAQVQSYLPGGSNYGYPSLAAAAGLYTAIGNAATFGGAGVFGGTALASGFLDIGGKYSVNRGALYPTVEVCFKYTTTPVSAYIIGDPTWMGIQTASTGAFVFTFGNGSNRVTMTSASTYNDGKYHHVAISAGPNGVKCFVDGVVVGSSATTYALGYGSSNTVTSIGGWSNRSVSPVPGLISEAITWATNKYPAAFTPRTQPVSALVSTAVGVTDGLTCYAPLNGTLNTYV
jgi:hypothetical protein